MTTCLRRIVLLLAISSLHVLAQPGVPRFQPPLQQATPDSYRARLESLRGLVGACRDDAKACNSTAVGDDELIRAPNETFQVRRQWLRKLIEHAAKGACP